MVEHCATLQHRLLPFLLVLGGALVLWWTLMTGTAHAAESPVDPLSHTVSALQQRQVQPVVHHVEHVEHVTRAVTDAATAVVRDAPVVKTQKPVIDQVPAVQQAPTAPHAGHPARHRRATRTHLLDGPQTTTLSSSPGAGAARAGTDDSETHQAHQAHRAAGAPHRAGCPRDSTPTDSGTLVGSGSGPVSGALVEHLRAPELLASGEHSADPGPDLPAEPAYPPGCSPD